ncbi:MULTISPECIES: sigma D regulator [unclassified Neptuniibacter]|uniref:sigma D regulator n=1 Tax=unclassified Neptuniibacter TaxID=2630693 RepID=UPI000C3C619E|nr:MULTISPECIES: sigma D regulator [unclassified Neptuniibacter]MAY42006.1 sigma D regulator [Oceanospirillaceae bacterium]|tara:strand:- start:15883 stop:16353 length:471 start_codon:yes stop_codon:yes gene_type:complete
MLEKCKSAKERWGGVSGIIDGWLEERQMLISLFVHLPEHHINEELNSKIQGFCEVLMDYLSSGHFEVYEQLLREGSDFADGSLEEGQELLPKIQVSTDIALDFNDDFSNLLDPTVQQIREFSEHLSKLGEALEERFKLEDQMIAVLHTSHREVVAG